MALSVMYFHWCVLGCVDVCFVWVWVSEYVERYKVMYNWNFGWNCLCGDDSDNEDDSDAEPSWMTFVWVIELMVYLVSVVGTIYNVNYPHIWSSPSHITLIQPSFYQIFLFPFFITIFLASLSCSEQSVVFLSISISFLFSTHSLVLLATQCMQGGFPIHFFLHYFYAVHSNPFHLNFSIVLFIPLFRWQWPRNAPSPRHSPTTLHHHQNFLTTGDTPNADSVNIAYLTEKWHNWIMNCWIVMCWIRFGNFCWSSLLYFISMFHLSTHLSISWKCIKMTYLNNFYLSMCLSMIFVECPGFTKVPFKCIRWHAHHTMNNWLAEQLVEILFFSFFFFIHLLCAS